MNLEKMFQQIMQSEETAKSRLENITTAERQIAERRSELKSLKESCACLRGRLHIQVRQYHEENAECTSLIEQRKALEERRDEAKKDIETRKVRLQRKREDLEKCQDGFSKEVIEFCRQYDLTGDGSRKRKLKRVEELSEILEEKREREKHLHNMQLKEDELRELEGQRALLKKEISQLQSQIIEVDVSLNKKRQETAEAENTVQQFKSRMHLDPELIQLQKELDSIKNNDLERKVRNLKAELARVQRQKWQHSLHEQNQPRSGPSPREYKFRSINQISKPGMP